MSTTTSPSAWSTGNTRLAAAFAGMGFVVVTRDTIIAEKNAHENIRFHVGDVSVARPELQREWLYRAYREGSLPAEHPLLAGLAACRNVDALMQMQKTGQSHALALEGAFFIYRSGVEHSALAHAPCEHRTRDLLLAGAVGITGLPVTQIEGAEGSRRYGMPDTTLRHLAGELGLPTVTQLLTRRRVPPHPHALQIGITHPQHPLSDAYNAARAYGVLLREVRERNILLKDPYSKRRVLTPENPSPRLEEETRRFFRIP